MSDHDYIIVGSGINALVAAAILGKKGRKVLVLERNDRIGGCLRSEEITEPGFIHDVMATTMVLFLTSPAYGAIGKDLEARGLEFAHADLPTGVLRPDGSHVIFSKDRRRNIATFDELSLGDGQTFLREMDALAADAPFLFALLGGALWSGSTLRTVVKQGWGRGLRKLAAWFGNALMPARSYLETTYRSEDIHALWAPWVLHCGLGPESAYSAEMLKVIGFAIELAGTPVVKGGADALLTAFERLITDNGGEIRTGADVESVTPGPGGRAGGVKLASGETLNANAGVICSVTPNQLYERLIKDWPSPLPPDVKTSVARYRYGKGNMQIHYALSEPPRWKADDELGKVALLHLTPGLDGVSRAANECERGLLPAEPTVCIGQPVSFDPSRAPEGKSILWLQLPEAPRHIKGDAAGEIAIPPDGRWTEEVRERYADRIESLLESHIEKFSGIKLARRSYSPADLEAMNMNLVGGDPYGGYCGIDQFFLWRPFKSSVNHRTHVAGLYHIGASTHPGPGLGGGSGFLLASSLK
ncbi:MULTISPECIES: NAD(P)/FAD-dependent oxidoreductase [unclassified Rhizobium]|uniref:phytoene desaturase family protein n=1 Tax=unclassified Rhizobium TaxID=2613769 RepID=UPI000CDF3BB1|nr:MULTISPECIES: NAD(P)/FAD-dependent oxidoreductase [Rhizobium]AVA22680.1 phytoene dehydrogenase-related protein [Rhizobium sp. NXC24]UWU20059.1 NAD(P)/FAD-dependent oxidoreductase [Rhizobium tropici]